MVFRMYWYNDRKIPMLRMFRIIINRNKFDDTEFIKGMQRECKECANGPQPGLRDGDLLFKRRFEGVKDQHIVVSHA